MRAFLAVEPSGEALGALQRIVGALEANKNWLRPVRRGQIHLTLRFFEDIPEAQAAAMKEALSGAGLRGFQAQLTSIGCFPKWKRPRVIWVGCSPAEEWKTLHSAVEEKLAALGFPSDRRFHPHITLARVTGPAASEEQFESVKNFAIPATGFAVTELILKKSVLTPKGAEHAIAWKIALSWTQDI